MVGLLLLFLVDGFSIEQYINLLKYEHVSVCVDGAFVLNALVQV